MKATAERGEPLRTEAQSKALWAGLSALNITDRDVALAYIGQIIDRDLDSTKNLTKAEATKVIDRIKAEQEQDDTQPEPLDGAA